MRSPESHKEAHSLIHPSVNSSLELLALAWRKDLVGGLFLESLSLSLLPQFGESGVSHSVLKYAVLNSREWGLRQRG